MLLGVLPSSALGGDVRILGRLTGIMTWILHYYDVILYEEINRGRASAVVPPAVYKREGRDRHTGKIKNARRL